MSQPAPALADRRISPILDALANVEPVIAIHGPRAVGKSTVLAVLAASRGVPVLDLDDPILREAALANPTLAVGATAPICLDEYQRALVLLDAIKARLNREGSLAGTAVLTGSTRQDALPLTAQTLTGRLHSLTIWPLSQGEIGGVIEDLLVAVRHDPEGAVAAHPASPTTRADYVERVLAGGFPLAIRREGAARNRWFDDYVTQSVERDAFELAKIRQRQVLRQLLSRLAGRTGQVLDLTKAADGLAVDRTTLEHYTRLLEDLFLIQRLPAWGKTLRMRSIAKPKVHVIDSGLASRLMRVSSAKWGTLDPTALTEFGNLLETFVVGELRKQVSWIDEPVAVGHWRTHDGDEVDLIVEFDDGRVIACEVKANERVSGDDFRGLRKLREALGDRLIAGLVFSTGPRSYTFGTKLHVLPVDRLWRPVAG